MAASARNTNNMKNFVGTTLIVVGILTFFWGLYYEGQEEVSATVKGVEIALNNSIPHGINFRAFVGGIVAVIGIIVCVIPTKDPEMTL